MGLLKKCEILAAKIEATPGTYETLAAADGAFNVFDIRATPQIGMQERGGQQSLSPLAQIATDRKGQITFSMEMVGSGTPATDAGWASTLLPACGLGVTAHVFTPTSVPPEIAGSKAKTISIGCYQQGRFIALRGCMGNAVMTLESGKPGRIEFTFTGIWQPVVDAAIISPDNPVIVAPRYAGGTSTIGGHNLKISTLKLDLGNEVYLRPYPTDVSGYAYALITGRKPTGTFDAEAELVATIDRFGDQLAGTLEALAIQLGAGGSNGNTIAIAAPKLQLTKVGQTDRSGLIIDDCEFMLCRSADTGDDEFSLTFS